MITYRRFTPIVGLLLLFSLLLSLPLTAQDAPQRTGIRPDAPPYGIRGPHPVGTLEWVIEPESDRPLLATVWYPALNPEGLEEKITYPLMPEMPVYGRALADAAMNMSDAPYPLIVFSHGNASWRSSAPYLMEQLASYGFVVIGIDHFGNSVTSGSDIELLYQAMVLRPIDITRTLDAATELTAEDSTMAGMINIEQIGVIGISFGGYTTFMAGGARISMNGFEELCTEIPNQSPGCVFLPPHIEDMAKFAGLETTPEDLWPAWHDDRVDAIVPIVPGPAGVIRQGAQAVSVPTMMIIGSNDMLVPAAGFQYPVWENLTVTPRALVEFQGGGHTFSVAKCADIPWSGGYQWWCSDPVWDMDRAHDLVDHFVTAFFLATLKDDAEAAAALAPDAVALPGIRYQSEGF